MAYSKGRMTPLKSKFLNRLMEGQSTVDEILKELAIRPITLGRWLQVGTFARQYQIALKQLAAQAQATQAMAKLRRARQQLGANQTRNNPETTDPGQTGNAPQPDSAMARRLAELHGPDAAAEKLQHMQADQYDD